MAGVYLGLGTLVKVDENDDGTSHTTCTLVIDATPPARKRVRVDATHLTSTLSVNKPGIEDFSQFSFTQYWEPGDTQHEAIDTLFGSKAEVEWQIVYTSGETDEFEGWVGDMEPQPAVKDQHYQRKVVIERTSAITRTVA